MIAPTTQMKNPNRGQRIKTASKQYIQKSNNYEKLINQSQCEPCGLETVDLYQNVAILRMQQCLLVDASMSIPI